MSISSELNKKDKSIQGRIRYHGGVLADLVRAAEELQTNIDNACAKAYQQGFDDGRKAEYKGPRSLTREEALELHYAMWNDMRKELGDKPSSLARINFKRRWINGFAERIIMNLYDCAYVDRYCAETTDCDKCVIQDNCDNYHEDIEITRELLHKMVQTVKESTPDKGGGK